MELGNLDEYVTHPIVIQQIVRIATLGLLLFSIVICFWEKLDVDMSSKSNTF